MIISNIVHTFNDWPDSRAKYGALTVFIPGCDIGCQGCHNSRLKTLPPNAEDVSPQEVAEVLSAYRAGFPDKELYIVLSGGDPLSTIHREETAILLQLLSNNNAHVTLYTGNEYADVVQFGVDLSALCYLKCGKFDKTKAQQSGHFNGAFFLASTNQALYANATSKVSVDGVFNYRKE